MGGLPPCEGGGGFLDCLSYKNFSQKKCLRIISWPLEVFNGSNKALYANDQSDGPLYVIDQSNLVLLSLTPAFYMGHFAYN